MRRVHASRKITTRRATSFATRALRRLASSRVVPRHFAFPSDFISASLCARSYVVAPPPAPGKTICAPLPPAGADAGPACPPRAATWTKGRARTRSWRFRRAAPPGWLDIAATPPVRFAPRPPPVRLMELPAPAASGDARPSPAHQVLVRGVGRAAVHLGDDPCALARARRRSVGARGDSGGESLSGLTRFPLPAASATALFSSFCDSASSQHASSSMGSIASVIFSNSLRTRAVTPSHTGWDLVVVHASQTRVLAAVLPVLLVRRRLLLGRRVLA